MPITHQTPATLLVDEFRMSDEERLNLGLDRLHQHPPGAVTQDGQQRIAKTERSKYKSTVTKPYCLIM